MKTPLLTILLVAMLGYAQAQKTSSQPVLKAAQNFLKLLDEQQTAKAVIPFADDERYDWNFVPKARKGLPLKEMNAAQKDAAINLLKASLSQQGEEKIVAIMQLDIILKEIEHRKPEDGFRDPEKYYFSIFGKPDAKENWGWRVDGHHVSLNFSSVNGKVASETPSFMGSNPAIVPNTSSTDVGKQVLKQEANLGFQLLGSLSEEQLKKAVISETSPNEIVTSNSRKAIIEKMEGITFAELNKNQQQQFMQLISLYIKNYPFGFADEFMAKIEKAGLDNLHFAWAGAKQWGQGHYYRIQNPVLLIEYDNTQNNANHVHTVVRDLTNDFGEDILQKHYQMDHAKQ